MPESDVSRRGFFTAMAGIIGGIIGVAIGVPAIAYVLDPAFKSSAKETWISIGKLSDMQVGQPYPFSFAIVEVNGWERTSTSHGGFVLRKSNNPTDMIILNYTCTHLGCTVDWQADAQAFICPCHNGKFSKDGAVLAGPPPRPLDRYTDFRLTNDGSLEIYYKGS